MQSLTQSTEQKSLVQFLENYDLTILKPQILDLQKEGFSFEFSNCAWNLSRVFYKGILIGVDCLEKPNYLKLVLAHEIAHAYRNLEGIRETDKVKREINAWKEALAILNLTEDIESIEFSQNCINSYLNDYDLCMCESCKEKRENSNGIYFSKDSKVFENDKEIKPSSLFERLIKIEK